MRELEEPMRCLRQELRKRDLRVKSLETLQEIAHWQLMMRFTQLKTAIERERLIKAGFSVKSGFDDEFDESEYEEYEKEIEDQEDYDEFIEEVLGDEILGPTDEEIAEATNWGNPKTLQQHFAEHGADFDSKTASEYAQEAQNFMQNAINEGYPTIQYPNGEELGVYNPETNTFGVFNSNGSTATFYKPTSLDYFERELADAVSRGSKVIKPLASTEEDDDEDDFPDTENGDAILDDDFFLDF